MATPMEKRAQGQPSAVASCAVTNCKFNEDRECHAGEIDVRFGDGQQAICGTYEPEKPKARP